jgi:hypothetical protein
MIMLCRERRFPRTLARWTKKDVPLSPLPPITDPVTLVATTQPGYAGAPLVQLNGNQPSRRD